MYNRVLHKMLSSARPVPHGRARTLERLAISLRGEAAINQAIAEADPLGVDEAFLSLPARNEKGDSEGIRSLLARAVASAQSMPQPDFIRCSAAVRDVSMLGASLVRYGLEPADCEPAFSDVLLFLSTKTASHIPRDSFIDYTSRNPVDKRERTFTALPQERLFIASLRRGMDALNTCLYNMMSACMYPFAREECALYLHSATDDLQNMIDAIVQVKRGITPEVFTHHIRPFFEPFRVGDRGYSAPSGAEMPILNIDQIIWGADCSDELYATYLQANIIRLPQIYRTISQRVSGRISLITMLKDRLAADKPFSCSERVAIQELHQLLTKLYSFRMPHYRVAQDNVILREKESSAGQVVKGSSGFGLVETKYVLDQTIKCRQITSQALAFHAQSCEKV